MKACPTCNRTYADETLTYCLADGSLLSAPYDPEATQRLPLSRSTNPTKTEVLLSSPPIGQSVKQTNNSTLKYIVIALLALIAGGGIVAWLNSGNKEAVTSNSSSIKPSVATNTSSTSTSTSNITTKVDNPSPQSISILGYNDAKWNEYGPGVDKTNTNQVTQLWMRASGYITYQVTLPETKKNLVVIAHLSSELNKTTSASQSNSSDVTLIVNGQTQGMQNVIPDNGIGADYQWVVSNDVLRKGNNEITFKVGEGTYMNGLVIYKPIQLKFQ